MSRADYKLEDKDIVVFHVGGGYGQIGPASAVTGRYPNNTTQFLFEALLEASTKDVAMSTGVGGLRTWTFNKCIGARAGEVDFYVNKHRESSSLLPGAPGALTEDPSEGLPPSIFTWGQNVEVERIEKVNTVSLKDFIDEVGVVPDVLSIDAQGAELDILKGCGEYLKHITMFVTEVEFFPIYDGQGLFGDQQTLFTEHGVRVMDVVNKQYWHPGPAAGRGFMTVGEALWYKNVDDFLVDNADSEKFIAQGIRAAAIAFSLRNLSYMFKLLTKLQEVDPNVLQLCESYGYPELLVSYNILKKAEPSYPGNKYAFQEQAKHCPA